jgi:hypothetical protein
LRYHAALRSNSLGPEVSLIHAPPVREQQAQAKTLTQS